MPDAIGDTLIVVGVCRRNAYLREGPLRKGGRSRCLSPSSAGEKQQKQGGCKNDIVTFHPATPL